MVRQRLGLCGHSATGRCSAGRGRSGRTLDL